MSARRELGDLIARVEETSNAMDRRDASGWLVVCVDLEAVAFGEADTIVACYGPFATPEIALIEAGRHQATSLSETHLAEPGEPGWAHFVKPLFPPIEWKPTAPPREETR
jgi:hypothetical protein